MTNIILFDNADTWVDLLPITYTRPISDIRVGILTIREKWQHRFPDSRFSWQTTHYLSEKYPMEADGPDNLFIAGNYCPTDELSEAIRKLKAGTALMHGDELIAFRGSVAAFEDNDFSQKQQADFPVSAIHMLYDIFGNNGEELVRDFALLTNGRTSRPLSDSCRLIGPAATDDRRPMVFIEEGASIEGAILNTSAGPIYIGENATIMEGSCIRGPFAACEHSQVNMGSKVYGATTLGPWCKVGGEINNIVMLGYSNKAHDGFLGNSVIGEWCNIGAGTNASNLKNDYSEIKLWNYRMHRFMRTGLQFCGLIMGDHSESGINTMFNTATVTGIGVNIFGTGFPRQFIASFTKGNPAGYSDVTLEEFFGTASRMMARRHKELSDADKRIFDAIRNYSDNFK